MNWLSKKLIRVPELRPNETVRWKYPVSSWEAGNRDIGGTLYVTDRALIFNPHAFTPRRYRLQRAYPLDNVVSVERVGGRRRQLRIVCRDGSSTIFGVAINQNLDELVSRLDDEVTEFRRSQPPGIR